MGTVQVQPALKKTFAAKTCYYMKTIPFTAILFVVIPELRKLPRETAKEIIEQARQSSKGQLRTYYAIFFFPALALPFIVLLAIFHSLGWLERGKVLLSIPALAILGSLCFSTFQSLFTALALRPEIRKRLM